MSVLFVTVFYFALIIRLFESQVTFQEGQNFNLGSFYNSLWLIFITMTTVGYGDMYPVTYQGRFFGIFACLIGILLVSYYVVVMISLFDFTV